MLVDRWMRDYTFWAYTEDDPVMTYISVSHAGCLWSWEVKTLPEAIHAATAHHLTAHPRVMPSSSCQPEKETA